MLDELEELAREHMMLISNSEALGPENVGFLTQGLIFDEGCTSSSGDDNEKVSNLITFKSCFVCACVYVCIYNMYQRSRLSHP